MTTEYRRMQQRRGAAGDWSLNNVILLPGEFGVQSDPAGARFKIGDGVTAWADLPWSGENDPTARSQADAATAALAALDIRVVALEDLPGDLATLQAQVDSQDAAITAINAGLPAGNAEGDLLYWDGSAFVPTTYTIAHGSLFFWNATATEIQALPAPTPGHYLRASVGGLPVWTSDVRVVSGTAGVPAVAFTDDEDTGVFRVGADQLGVAAGGVLRLTVGARFLADVNGDGVNGYTRVRLDKDEANEVILEATDVVNAATKHTLNLNKGGGSVLINDAAVSSSITLKREVEPWAPGAEVLDVLRALRVVSFRRRDRNDRRRELGFVAEEVARIAPDAVMRDDEGNPRALFLMDMLAVVARSAQAMLEEITTLRREMDALKASSSRDTTRAP